MPALDLEASGLFVGGLQFGRQVCPLDRGPETLAITVDDRKLMAVLQYQITL